MFNFLFMMDNHEDRMVDRYEDGEDFIIDTCYANDTPKPYETAVMHPSYNNGRWVIVEDYNKEDEAQIGHNKWVEIMTADKLPDQLVDIATSGVAQFLSAITDNEEEFVFTRRDDDQT